MSRVKSVFIGLGSNLEQPLLQIKTALVALSRLPETTLVDDSGYYLSKPMGPQDQPDYINAVVLIETTLQALTLLSKLQAIEQKQGRIRKQHWGARTIDLDILLYGDEKINSPRLTVPHPGICDRDFVYLPLLKVDQSVNIPGSGKLKSLIENSSKALTDYAANYLGPIVTDNLSEQV